MTYRSPLGRLIPDSINSEEIKRRAYREDGIVVINLNEDSLDTIERELIRQWAERRYPKKEQR